MGQDRGPVTSSLPKAGGGRGAGLGGRPGSIPVPAPTLVPRTATRARVRGSSRTPFTPAFEHHMGPQFLATSVLLLLPLPVRPVAGAADIDWQPSYETALLRAADEDRVLFVAVNMDGERANDRTADKTYHDKTVVGLSEHTLNLVASLSEHAKPDRTCPRFGDVTCADHRRVDIDVRENVLAPDDEGYVIAPQHVFLKPDGEVILSVPYEISAAELEWCFVTLQIGSIIVFLIDLLVICSFFWLIGRLLDGFLGIIGIISFRGLGLFLRFA